jgi:hypothetical protein
MTRAQLEHIIRAASTIAEDDEIIVLGSQAVLGQYPDAPPELCASNEADVYPKNHPARWNVIDGAIGELSPFHETFGYYAQGVEEGTAVLPPGWAERLIAVQTPATRGATGLCLEIHDLLLSKYIAGRGKDRAYARAAIRGGMVDRTTLLGRLRGMPVPAEKVTEVSEQIASDWPA